MATTARDLQRSVAERLVKASAFRYDENADWLEDLLVDAMLAQQERGKEAERQRDEALALLRSMEFREAGSAGKVCPVCDGWYSHQTECRLAALLTEAGEGAS